MFYQHLPSRLSRNITEMYKSDLDEGSQALMKAELYDLEKGRPAMPIGAHANWNGIDYLKTASGWKPSGKLRGHVKENHDALHHNEVKDKDHHAMMSDAGSMTSEEWTKKHGSDLHAKYKGIHDYLHKEKKAKEDAKEEFKTDVNAKNTVDLIKEAVSNGTKEIKVKFKAAYDEKEHGHLKEHQKDLLKNKKEETFNVVTEGTEILDLIKNPKAVLSITWEKQPTPAKEDKPLHELTKEQFLEKYGENYPNKEAAERSHAYAVEVFNKYNKKEESKRPESAYKIIGDNGKELDVRKHPTDEEFKNATKGDHETAGKFNAWFANTAKDDKIKKFHTDLAIAHQDTVEQKKKEESKPAESNLFNSEGATEEGKKAYKEALEKHKPDSQQGMNKLRSEVFGDDNFMNLKLAGSLKGVMDEYWKNKDSEDYNKKQELTSKEQPAAKPEEKKGTVIGKTQSGKDIYDNPTHAAHKDFDLADHNDAILANRNQNKKNKGSGNFDMMGNDDYFKHQDNEESHRKLGMTAFKQQQQDEKNEERVGLTEHLKTLPLKQLDRRKDIVQDQINMLGKEHGMKITDVAKYPSHIKRAITQLVSQRESIDNEIARRRAL